MAIPQTGENLDDVPLLSGQGRQTPILQGLVGACDQGQQVTPPLCTEGVKGFTKPREGPQQRVPEIRPPAEPREGAGAIRQPIIAETRTRADISATPLAMPWIWPSAIAAAWPATLG